MGGEEAIHLLEAATRAGGMMGYMRGGGEREGKRDG